jgi:hypothetical protein
MIPVISLTFTIDFVPIRRICISFGEIEGHFLLFHYYNLQIGGVLTLILRFNLNSGLTRPLK